MDVVVWQRRIMLAACLCLFFSCMSRPGPGEQPEQAAPDAMNDAVADYMELIAGMDSLRKDSIPLAYLVQSFYQQRDFQPVWTDTGTWRKQADSLYLFSSQVEDWGLIPAYYPLGRLDSIRRTMLDSVHKREPIHWAEAELWWTSQFFLLSHDLWKGRLAIDSVVLRPDSAGSHHPYHVLLDRIVKGESLSAVWGSIEPTYADYWALKNAVPAFVDSMDRSLYTFVSYPYKKGDAADSLLFVKTLMKRLGESGCWEKKGMPDTTAMRDAIRCYQRKKALKADGVLSRSLVGLMNTNDQERFRRVNITLDRYRLLPRKRPDLYIQVNLPAFLLRVIQGDTLVLESRVIIGKPGTPTPTLQSKITNMITYPTWTVPTSIISKEYLPKLKNNPGYLSRIGLKLLDSKGQQVDPRSVNWSKYSKGIPYKVMQGSGDNNALGVLKFNFDNPYAVYLHDTNQRSLFKNSNRAYSHGCVRVQEWDKLAFFLARNDSLNASSPDSLRYTADSIRNWIAAKQHRRIMVQEPVPLFIEYFSCGVEAGKIRFYEDVYSSDQAIRAKAGKLY
jgi:murein L,D-transpeptidase YcbB/YkuD